MPVSHTTLCTGRKDIYCGRLGQTRRALLSTLSNSLVHAITATFLCILAFATLQASAQTGGEAGITGTVTARWGR